MPILSVMWCEMFCGCVIFYMGYNTVTKLVIILVQTFITVVHRLWIPAFAGMTGRVVWNDGCLCLALHLWIDESPITLCQRVRFQRRRTLFLIVLVP